VPHSFVRLFGFCAVLFSRYGGVWYSERGLELSPSLPPGNTTRLVIRGLSYADGNVRLAINLTHMTLSHTAGVVGLNVGPRDKGGES
jgi:hypothetical protein